MISWIKGDLISTWQINNKFFILLSCQDIGYEIQILESIFIKLKTNQISEKNIILWIKHIKKEDSDSLFGFISKEQKDFFIDILNIRGIGSQIGMSLLNKFSVNELINAIYSKDKKLISSVPGIGNKMTDRIIIELESSLITKSKIKNNNVNVDLLEDNIEINSMIKDIDLTLQSLNFSKKEIKNIIPKLIKDIRNNNISKKSNDNISFEKLLKEALNYLDNNNSNLDQ